MSWLGRILIALLVALGLWRRRGDDEGERIVPAGERSPRAELVVLLLLFGATLCAVGFVVIYAIDAIGNQTQLLGLALGLCFALVAAALIVISRHLVVTEDNEEDYPEPGGDQESQAELTEILRESNSRFTRKRLMAGAGGVTAAAMGAALITPVASFGPWLDTDSLKETPWRRGLRLIGVDGLPLFADQIEQEVFYTAFPEHAPRDVIGSPVIVVRLDPAALRLPPERAGWAPGGILAYSKICTHAGCAISLYRTPKFAPTQPRPALVCPCHYSTFDPARGAKVMFGPAGRPLPQLPLMVGDDGILRAAGTFSERVGPAWGGVRGKPRSV